MAHYKKTSTWDKSNEVSVKKSNTLQLYWYSDLVHVKIHRMIGSKDIFIM